MRRLVIGMAVGALALTLVSPGASAAPSAPPPREDAVGDVAQPKGDIVTGTYTASFIDIFLTRVKGRVTLRQGSNPLTAGGWLMPATGLTMQLDTTNTHTGPDLAVVLRAVDEGGVEFVADVTDLVANEPVFCSATASFTAPNVYKANLPADCLPGDVTSVRGRFRMRWDTPPAGGTVTLDNSPDSGWGSTLVAAP